MASCDVMPTRAPAPHPQVVAGEHAPGPILDFPGVGNTLIECLVAD